MTSCSMIEINDYKLKEIYFDKAHMTPANWSLWIEAVAHLMYQIADGKPLTLLKLGTDIKDLSIGYDIGSHVVGQTNLGSYLASVLMPVVEDELVQIVRDHEFHLGNSVLVKGIINEEAVRLLSICWNNPLLTNLELFQMACDGYSLYWHNYKSESQAAKYIDNLMTSLNSHTN